MARDPSLTDRRAASLAAARAMRRSLVDEGRTRGAVDLGRLDAALGELEPALVDLIDLRYFGGLGAEAAAEILGLAPEAAEDLWRRAREAVSAVLGGTDGLDWSPVAPSERGGRIGQRIGAYQIDRPIGSGGMGTVYLAHRADGLFHQDVAVKLVKRGMDTDAIIERFHTERQILAGLEHPNICRLLDGGVTEDGLPHFVMELISGEPIDVYCARRELGLVDRLALYLAVCDAVNYAHQNLIVHRDIKPRNILVAENGVPKLLDFGIAKFLGPGGSETRTATMLMTPDYASPEQLRGEPVTTATDVHALGILLYELGTGKNPFAGGARAVLEDDPPPPSQVAGSPRLRRLLRGDLDNIAATALRKEPARRYASAERLAADVRRHLAHEPIEARRDSVGYRAAKFVRRHRFGVAAAAVIVFLLAASTIVTARQAALVRRERDAARAERDQARAVSDFVTALFDVDPLADDEGTSDTMPLREFLTRSEEKVRRDLKSRPELQASLLGLLCRLHGNLGRLDRARPLCKEALALRQKLGDSDSPELAEILTCLGTVEQDDGDYASAETHFRRALAIREALYGRVHPDVAEAVNNLAVLLSHVRRPETAAEEERLLRLGLDLRRTLFGPDHSDTAQSLNNLAVFLYFRRGAGDLAEAADLYRQGIAIRVRRLGEHHPLVAVMRSNLANALRELGQLDESEALFRAAIADYRAALGPGNPREAKSWFGLHKTLAARGDLDGAVEALEHAIDIDERTLPADHPQRAEARKTLEELRRRREQKAP